jgi:peptidoglycan endopeptidase LytE
VAEAIAPPSAQTEPLRAPVTYEVAPGDTVSTVAARFGVDAETIVTANSLSNPDRIKVGDELTILPVSGVVHTVRAGQTLSGIAALYKVDLGPIIDFNYLDDADIIAVGKELIIPGARPLPAPATARPVEYDVAPGDTLSSIGARFGVSPGAIASANGIRNPDLLTVGNRLVIPNARGQAGQQVVTRNLPVPSGPSGAGVPAPADLGGGSSIMSIAVRYQGARYVWGGTSPAGFDCSGFVYYVQAQSGQPVPRGLWGQYNAGPHPSKNELLPGDVVFFQNTYMAGLSHNGIYIGGGQFISAVDERSGVRISSLWEPYWANRWFGATRVW